MIVFPEIVRLPLPRNNPPPSLTLLFDAIEFGPTTQVEVAGFPGTQFEAFVVATSRLWQEGNVGPGEATTSAWWLQSNQEMRFIIVDTPAGTLLITIGADAEKWDDFLPVAEEILAGISFPDLG